MDEFVYLLFVSGTLALGLGILGYLAPWGLALVRLAVARLAPVRRAATAPAGGEGSAVGFAAGVPGTRYGTLMTSISFALFAGWVVARTIAGGRAPVTNMYEFSVVFTMGIIGVYLATYARYHSRALGVVVLPVGMAMLLYAASVSSDIKPLVPALQNNVLMVHITVGVMAYSCFTVAFGAGVLYLVQERLRRPSLPSLETLDEIGFSGVAFGFPFMVLLLVLGAYWANAAWGRYWGWDPKETASLVTLLIYAGYLHTRALRNWRGRRGAILLLIGFASVMLTYFGNYFLTGLHAYK